MNRMFTLRAPALPVVEQHHLVRRLAQHGGASQACRCGAFTGCPRVVPSFGAQVSDMAAQLAACTKEAEEAIRKLQELKIKSHTTTEEDMRIQRLKETLTAASGRLARA